MGNSVKFFLGANSAEGFINMFGNFKNTAKSLHTYIIKGGPGTGKSTFMKKAAKTDENAILFPCSSDVNSLDAVILPSKNIMLLDGTSPHTVDPEYPGVKDEIINLGAFWDSGILQKYSDEIINITDKNKQLHKKASAYIKAAGKAQNDNYGIALAAADIEKTVDFSLKLVNKYLINKNTNTGKEYTLFLSGITPDGTVNFNTSADSIATEKIVIADKYTAAADIILSVIRERAIKYGYTVISVPDALLGLSHINHIIIPELSLAFCCESDIKLNTNHRKISAKRFYDGEYLYSKQLKVKFNNKAKKELLNNAVEYLKQAKSVHDELESYYIKAMNYNSLNAFTDEFIQKISTVKGAYF